VKSSNLTTCCISIAILALAGWTSLSGASDSSSAENPAPLEESIPGPLDGMIFSGALGPDGKPKDILDSFVFEEQLDNKTASTASTE
jgi:hypothetical protein